MRRGWVDRVRLRPRPEHGRPGVKAKGKVGRDLTVEEGYATARAVALSMLASLKQELGDLDRVKRVVRLFGMVNVEPGSTGCRR